MGVSCFPAKAAKKQPRKSGASRLSKKLTLFRQKECASTARKLFAQSAKSSHWLSEQYVSGRQSRRITWISTLFRPAGRNSARLFGTQKAAPEIRGFQTVEKANAFSTKGMRLDCAQAFRAKREKLTLAQRAVCFRSAKPPDNMDFHFISPCGAKLCEAFRHTESSPGNPGLLALLSECAVFRYRLRCRCRTRRRAAPRPLWSSLRLPQGQTARCTHPGPAPRGSRGC